MGALLLVLSFFAVASLYQYERMKHSNQRLALVNDLFMPFSRQIAQIQSNLQTLADDMRRFYFTASADSEALALSRMARDLYPFVIQKKLARASQILSQQNQSEAGLEELSKRLIQTKKLFESFMKSRDQKSFEAGLQEIRAQLMELSKTAEDECQRITLTIQKEAKDSLLLSFVLASAILVLGGAAFTQLSDVEPPSRAHHEFKENFRRGLRSVS